MTDVFGVYNKTKFAVDINNIKHKVDSLGRRPLGRPRTGWRDYVSTTLVWERRGIPQSELVNVAPGKGSLGSPARAATRPRISGFEDYEDDVNSPKKGTKINSPKKRFWLHVEDQQLIAVGLFD